MLKYINNEEYKELLGTQSVPSDFDNLVIKASNYINYKTFGRINENSIPEQVKYVTCMIVDLINEEENKISEIGNLKSQNIEGWSETYSTPEEVKSDYEKKKQSVLKEYLWNVIGTDNNPLLYCGVC